MMDTRDEEDVLLAAPNDGVFPKAAVFVAVGVTVGFALLCWVDDFADFVVALAIFWVVNVLAWRYLLHALVRPAITASLKAFRAQGRPLLEERVLLLEEFLCGRWQWLRFGTMAAGILMLTLLARSEISQKIASRLPFLSPPAVQALAIALLIAMAEVWIWIQRIRRRLGIRLLEDLDRRFTVSA